jgi:2-polyprenyl-3-methyl-5-hydroxy-6-metoxy-1,4-benzoquinol methylase
LIIRYSDYIAHYALDAFDMTLTGDMVHFLRHSERRRFQTVARLLPAAGVLRVLDVGCGIGELTEMIAGRRYKTYALDLGFDSIRRASAKFRKININVPFVQGDVYRLPFQDSSFDAVVASEIIEHLDRPQDAIREIARVVRPGGCFVLSTPYRERLRYTICIHCNRKTPVNAHLHSFDEPALQTLLREAGFSIKELKRFSSKALEHFGMPGLTFFIPHAWWLFIDGIFCGIFGKQSFMVVRAQRGE